MEAKITTKPGFTVVGVKYFGQNKHNEIAQMWDTDGHRLEDIPHRKSLTDYYGVCSNMDDQGNFEYVAGIEVSEAGSLPEGMVRWDVPEQTYVVVPCTIPTIGKAYEFIHDTWLPQSEYKRADSPDFELYDETFKSDDPDSILYIYVQIGK